MDRKPDPDLPLVIGLLGGVASGKSTVAKLFADRGFVCIDADEHARAAVKTVPVRTALESRFGPEVFRADGSLDRARLATIVFADPEARHDLENITHPAVRRAIETELEAAQARGLPVLLDVPLLLEGGLIERCDFAIFIDTPAAMRRARAAARGWDEGELRRREAAQASLTVKRSAAEYTIDNSGTLQRICDEVDAVLRARRLAE